MDGPLAQSGPQPGGDALLLGHLMYSAPSRSRQGTAGSLVLSVLGHAAALSLALYLTSLPATGKLAPNSTPLLLVQPADAPAEEPPVPPQVKTDVPETVAPTPQGFKVLEAPVVVPDYIPAAADGPQTFEPDWGGVGTEGGTAGGDPEVKKPVSPEDVTKAPIFVPTAIRPELKNREAVQRALLRAYPSMLRDAGIAGRVVVWVLLDEGGNVMKTQVDRSSGVPQLDQAALGVAGQMRFSPGINADKPVKCWVSIPIQFSVTGN